MVITGAGAIFSWVGRKGQKNAIKSRLTIRPPQPTKQDTINNKMPQKGFKEIIIPSLLRAQNIYFSIKSLRLFWIVIPIDYFAA